MRARWVVLVAVAGCSFRPQELPPVCGNGVVERGEGCDDGDVETDPACDGDCQVTCGNGVVDVAQGELCDPGDPAGCPTACDDGIACTSDVLSGADCTAVCEHSAITDVADGDGCCPAGGTVATDSDCAASCGNGAVDPGETCDLGIATGAGACPTACDDLQACTTDLLVNAGSCTAACTSTPITAAVNGDGCCPMGANSTNDSDCNALCGNGVLDASETCDTAIASGAGACPTTCTDNNACTTNVLSNAGTCAAQCNFPPITMAVNGDGCCPPGANANTDTDCQPTCGNGVVEGTEQCDDGNNNNNDGCSNQCRAAPTAFRFTDLDLRDPHVFNNFGLGCRDFTDSAFGFNSNLQGQVRNDGNFDGKLDLSPTIVLRPLLQANAATTPASLYWNASCSSPIATTSCTPAGTPATLTATSATTGTCLGPIANTTSGYMPGVVAATGPCFATAGASITVELFGTPVTLTDARIGATYVGTPATSLTNGLLMGFLSQATADATILGGFFNGRPLSSLLAGGTNNCANHSDKDVNNGVSGWWIYFNFPAAKVPWTEP